MSYLEDFHEWFDKHFLPSSGVRSEAMGDNAEYFAEEAWFAAMRKYGPPVSYKRYGCRLSLGIAGTWYGLKSLFNGLYRYPYMNKRIFPYQGPRIPSWFRCLKGTIVNLLHGLVPFIDIPEAQSFRFRNLVYRRNWLRETFWFM